VAGALPRCPSGLPLKRQCLTALACTLRRMNSAEEIRLIEVLITHNEPVSCADLACALGMTRAGVQELAIKLQTLGYAVVDDNTDTVAASPAADAAALAFQNPSVE
jgi:biotin operon repressor